MLRIGRVLASNVQKIYCFGDIKFICPSFFIALCAVETLFTRIMFVGVTLVLAVLENSSRSISLGSGN